MRYFSKNPKEVKKRGDTGIEHKRDVKHNSKLRKTFHKRQNLEKGNQQRNRKKQGDISKRSLF